MLYGSKYINIFFTRLDMQNVEYRRSKDQSILTHRFSIWQELLDSIYSSRQSASINEEDGQNHVREQSCEVHHLKMKITEYRLKNSDIARLYKSHSGCTTSGIT